MDTTRRNTITITDKYEHHLLGKYTPDIIALGNGTALCIGFEECSEQLKRTVVLLKSGTVLPLVSNIQDAYTSYYATGEMIAVCNYQKGCLMVHEHALALAVDLAVPLILLPIRNPLPVDWAKRRRHCAQIQVLNDGNAALVLLTRAEDRTICDAIGLLEWNDHESWWVHEPVTLSWEDIPYERQTWSDQPLPTTAPCIRGFALHADNTVVVHTTGQRFLGGAGNARYGMDWSMFITLDMQTGRSSVLKEVALGFWQTSDARYIVLRSLYGKNIYIYDLYGNEKTCFKLTPKYSGAGKNGVVKSIYENDIWVYSTYGLIRLVLN